VPQHIVVPVEQGVHEAGHVVDHGADGAVEHRWRVQRSVSRRIGAGEVVPDLSGAVRLGHHGDQAVKAVQGGGVQELGGGAPPYGPYRAEEEHGRVLRRGGELGKTLLGSRRARTHGPEDEYENGQGQRSVMHALQYVLCFRDARTSYSDG
jgi:hypothetical protein